MAESTRVRIQLPMDTAVRLLPPTVVRIPDGAPVTWPLNSEEGAPKVGRIVSAEIVDGAIVASLEIDDATTGHLMSIGMTAELSIGAAFPPAKQQR